MNHYGARAQQHWQTFLPTMYSQISDPETFFTQLGEQVEEEIDTQAEAQAGPDPVGESYLEKLGRLRTARQAAEHQVLQEMVLLPAEPGSPMDETEPGETPFDSETSPPLQQTPVRSTDWIRLDEDHPVFPQTNP